MHSYWDRNSGGRWGRFKFGPRKHRDSDWRAATRHQAPSESFGDSSSSNRPRSGIEAAVSITAIEVDGTVACNVVEALFIISAVVGVVVLVMTESTAAMLW